MQSKEQRRYWAEKRKQKPEPWHPKAHPTVLLARSPKEYDELRQQHPGVTVHLHQELEQTKLFDDKEYHDA